MPNPEIIALDDANCWLLDAFIPAKESYTYLQTLIEQLPWREDKIQLFGRQVSIPRLQTFMADEGISYTYSGLQLQALPWHPLVMSLKDDLLDLTGVKFNAVLLNLYRDGQDSMGWHQDNEPELGDDPIVASISLGAERRFLFRNKHNQQKKVELKLNNGSLLWMGSGVQKVWQHSVPKTKRCQSPRINLTFRYIQSS